MDSCPQENVLEADRVFSSFDVKKAEEYVKGFGHELAVEKLSILAPKSSKAKEMLRYIVDKYCKPASKQVNVVSDGLLGKINYNRPATRVQLDEKQQFLNLVCRLGLSYDVLTDGHFHPVVPVSFVDGKAVINGYNVVADEKYKNFMASNVLSRYNATVNMILLRVAGQDVVGIPDMNRFYARMRRIQKEKNQERERIEYERNRIRKFEGTVLIGTRGIFIRSSEVKKRIMVPKRFLQELLLDRGVWMFVVIDEKDNFVLARPVEKVQDEVVEPDDDGSSDVEKRRPVPDFAVENRVNDLYKNGSVKL